MRERNRFRSWLAGSQRLPTTTTCGFGGLGGDPLQAAEALGGEAADPGLELGRGGGQRVVLPRLHAQHPRLVSSARAVACIWVPKTIGTSP